MSKEKEMMENTTSCELTDEEIGEVSGGDGSLLSAGLKTDVISEVKPDTVPQLQPSDEDAKKASSIRPMFI